MSQTPQDVDESGNVLTVEVYEQFQKLREAVGVAMTAQDENALIQAQAKLQEFAAKNNIHLSEPVTVQPDQPVPDEGYVKPGGWGASTDPNTWKVTNMKNPPSKFKVVDDKGVNVATDFTTTTNAAKYIEKAKTNPPPPPPPPPTGERDAFGILKIRPDGPDKRWETKFSSEFKTRHYASGKPDEPTVECTNDAKKAIKNQEATIAFQITSFKKQDDTASFKILGGVHSSSNPKTGTCYDCQLNVFGGNGNLLELERPHPEMHPAHKQVKNYFKIGESIVNKWIVMKMVTYTINGGKDRHLEMQLAFPIADITKPEEITFRKYWEVDDVGQLEAGHIIEPIGALTTLRIDGVNKNGLQVKYASVRDIVGE